MAKKGPRIKVVLICEVCNSKNYITVRNKINTTEKLRLKKYCPKCKKKTWHKESKKLS